MLSVLIRIAPSRRFYWVHATYYHFVEDRKHFHKLTPFASWPGAWINLTSSNYPSVEQISMVPKMFEPLKFNCIRNQGDQRRSVCASALCDESALHIKWTLHILIANNITKTRLFIYTENFTTKKWKTSDKNPDIFHISAQNIDCGDSLEPPRWGGSNEYPQSMF